MHTNRQSTISFALSIALAFAAGMAMTSLDYHGDYQERYPGYAEDGLQSEPTPRLGRPLSGVQQDRIPCRNLLGKGEAELCAQWRAANAAKQAAHWALWQLFLSIFGLLGLGYTLWFNKRAIDIALESGEDTERALAIAERNADAATTQVRISEETAKRQLRAYVGIERVFVDDLRVGATPFFHLDIKNFGQTPAYKYDVASYCVLADAGWNGSEFRFPDGAMSSPSSIAPLGSTRAYPSLGKVWSVEMAAELAAGTMSLYCVGKIEYTDAFDDLHTTWFSYVHDSRSKGTTTLNTRFGNEQT